MEPRAGAPWEWQPLPKIRQETKTRIKAKMKAKGERRVARTNQWIFSKSK